MINRDQLEAEVLAWYSAHLAVSGAQRSLKLAQTGPAAFRLAIDAADDSERTRVHDAFADWLAERSYRRDVRVHWMVFTESVNDQLARRDFFRDHSGRTMTVPLLAAEVVASGEEKRYIVVG